MGMLKQYLDKSEIYFFIIKIWHPKCDLKQDLHTRKLKRKFRIEIFYYIFLYILCWKIYFLLFLNCKSFIIPSKLIFVRKFAFIFRMDKESRRNFSIDVLNRFLMYFLLRKRMFCRAICYL